MVRIIKKKKGKGNKNKNKNKKKEKKRKEKKKERGRTRRRDEDTEIPDFVHAFCFVLFLPADRKRPSLNPIVHTVAFIHIIHNEIKPF